MTENRSPAFQFYPDKAMAGTIHLSPVAFRAYWRIVFQMWLHSEDYCSLPEEKMCLLSASGLSSKQFQKVWHSEIMPNHHPMFKRENNRIVCNGLRKEREKQIALSEQRRKAANAKHMQSKCSANALRQTCSLTPSPSLTPTPLLKESARGESPAPPLPAPAPNHTGADPFIVGQIADEYRKRQKSITKVVAYRTIANLCELHPIDRVKAEAERTVAGEPQWEIGNRLNGVGVGSGDNEMRTLLKQVEEDIQRKEAAKGTRR